MRSGSRHLQKFRKIKRSIIAKYCFQDCNLCHTLMIKYDIYTGVSELSTICSVPMDFIIRRGQVIRLLSFISKKCRSKKVLMPTLRKNDNGGSYEGAIVLKPKPDIYFEPVTVLDFSSLYPSEMIASDLSHDRIVEDECWLGDEGIHEQHKELSIDLSQEEQDSDLRERRLEDIEIRIKRRVPEA